MYCQNCGTQFEGNFCPNCGTPKNPDEKDTSNIAQDRPAHAQVKPRTLTSRWWFWVLLVLLVAALATALTRTGRTGDGTTVVPRKTQQAAAPQPESAASSTQEQLAIAQTVLLDEAGIRVIATGVSGEKWFGREIAVQAENNTDRAVVVQVRGVSVNGAMVSPVFSCNVEPGKKANDAIPIYRAALDRAGIRSIQLVELRIRVFDAENWNTILEGKPVLIQTNAYEGGTQEFDESGLLVLDQNGIQLIIRGEEDDSVWGKGVGLLMKNDSGRDVTIQLRGVSVNGYMFEPVFSCDITDGKLAYTTVFFSNETLDTNGVEQIEWMEFSIQVYDMNTWHSIFESEPVSVTFPF